QAIIYSVLNEEPKPLSDSSSSGFPKELARLLEKGLAKNPEERYESMDEVLSELRFLETDAGVLDSKRIHALRTKKRKPWPFVIGMVMSLFLTAMIIFFILSGDKSGDKPVGIAVLPIKSFSDAGEPDWFRESLTDALITDLSRISGLSVTSLSTVMRFKDSDRQVSQIAEELNVTYVLESSIIRVGKTVRLSTKLIDASKDMNVWAESFNRSSENVLALQSELAATIAKQVQVNLTSEEEAYLLASPAINAMAQEAYLKGRYFLIQRTDRALETAVRYFEEAIQLEPSYSSAHAGLAMTYSVWPWYSGSPLKDAFVKAKEAAQRGLELDPKSAEANLAFAFATLQGDLFWSEQELEGRFKDAIRQNPSYSAAHQYYGWFLFYTGRFEESRAVLARAKELDPLSVAIEVDTGWTYHFERDYESALRAYEEALVLEPNYALAYYHMAATHLANSKPDKAISAATKAIELGGRTPTQLAMLAAAHARAGEQHHALTLQAELFDFDDLGHDVTLDLALVYLALEAYDEAFAKLESANEMQNSKLRLLQIEPLWDPIRSDPRFVKLMDQLVRKVGPTLN
ncbi:hypothetical protein MJD09_01305, partial [bacterium]|nr:hypothetical protein [bacterium]